MKYSLSFRQALFLMPESLFKIITGRKRDVLFFWVPKCAGMSVYKTLVKYGCFQDRWLTPMEPFLNKGVVTFGHVNILQLVDHGTITQKYFDNAFKFGFVRNPYDRMISLFFYLKKIKSEEVPQEMTFWEFCQKVERGEHPPVGLYNYQGLNQCNPMVDWLTDQKGQLIVNFVGRYENLEEDFVKICKTIGINAKIPHENETEHRPYRNYYNAKTRSIVEKIYYKDLKQFDYDF